MTTKSLAVGLFAIVFLSSIVQPSLSVNGLCDAKEPNAEAFELVEAFELIYENSTYSITYPLEKSLKRNVTVVNTGDTYLELEFTCYIAELDGAITGWPQPQYLYLDPGETQTIWALLDPFFGDFGSVPGVYDRTIEISVYPREEPSSPLAKSANFSNLVTVISQEDVTKNSLVYGYVYDNTTKQSLGGVDVELLGESSCYSLRGGTQENGSYSIPCPAHNFTVRVEVLGYETFHQIIHTPENDSIQLDVYLDKATETANYTLTKTFETNLPLWRNDVSGDERYFVICQGHFENVGAYFPDLTEEYIENNSYIYLFDLSNDSVVWQYPVHGEVWCVDISEDGNYVAAPITNSEKVIFLNRSGSVVWDTNELGYEPMLSNEVKISHNNEYVAIGYGPGYLCLLNLSTGEKIWTNFTEGQITQVEFNEDDTHIYAGSGDGYLYLFDTSNGTMIWRTYIGTWPYRVHSLDVTPDESYIATGGKLGEVCLIAGNGTLLWNFDMMGCVFWVDISPDRKYVTVNSGGWYGTAVFDIEGNMLWYDSRLSYGGSVITAEGGKYMLGGTGPSTPGGVWNINGTPLWSYEEIPQGCIFYMTRDCSKMIASAPDGALYFFEGEITSLSFFDTSTGTTPSTAGTHNGTITPSYDVNISYMYTYPCAGTGGHAESVKIWNSTWNTTATWTGYSGDYHNITFDEPFILRAGETYNYTIITGSYPQIIHATSKAVTGGTITCTEFTDANGVTYNDWIPAIRLD